MANPASVVDRAVLALRRAGPAPLARAFAAGGLVGWVLVVVYYLEEVEGVRTLRPLFGALLALAFALRAYLLAGVARALVLPLLPPGTALPPMRFADVARTASVVATGLFVWLWLPIVGSYVGVPSAALLVLPLCLRGAVAPTWIARAGVSGEGGLRAFLRAAADLGEDRAKGIFVELLVLLGGMAVFVNLLAATAGIGLLGRSFLGLDVADLETFFSTRNAFVLLTLAVVATGVLEPLRAGVSAVLYVEARARRDGFDLEAAVRGLAAGAGRAVAIAVVVSTLAGAAVARADAASEPAEPVAKPDALSGFTERDLAVQEGIERALARPEFAEHAGEAPGRSFRELLDRFFEWLFEGRDLDLEPGDTPELAMPSGWVLGVVFGVLALVLVIVALRARASRRVVEGGAEDGAAREADPRDRPPESHLDEAARLAAEGAYRDAFRALYLATLVALDRRGAIAFDRSRTNWHYLRSMDGGPTREAFHRFTAIFDRKWYGDEATTELDYRLGRELADGICATAVERAVGAEP